MNSSTRINIESLLEDAYIRYQWIQAASKDWRLDWLQGFWLNKAATKKKKDSGGIKCLM